MCKANSLSLDLDIFKVWAGERLGPISTVCRHQRYGVAIVIYPLEGGLIADADGGYLTIIHLGLDTDIHDISILYSGVYHTISTAAEAEIAVELLWDICEILDILFSGAWITARYVTYDRTTNCSWEWLESGRHFRFFFLPGHYEGRGCL